ncbi:class I SAM-dependent methyltransferase [Roseibium salinum]|uniref:Class I SAM-dependent methyltransferase n=1 Tax=Roseibium salinum TaxID=1604349 RepID=A0ABT3R9S5_9HYPH|nr:class I SAM-dependent methyltransferase [Roseibium sp. DSM 29163]MCX2725882.1 class I SAM-dependent methyltransferase [Roseibium sp. DSM 29163]
MSVLKDRIRRQIANEGPLTVAQYITICLGDPQAGYYATREPFGERGDFITAPEVSQMFGELVGAVCLSAYQALGSPGRFQLAELGPGRGTLMFDLLRMAALRPRFLEAASLNLVETSQRLRQIQKKTLSRSPLQPQFRDRFADIPDGPLILVANEFFDALPVHQFVKTTDGWRERQIGLTGDGDLAFGAGAAGLADDAVPEEIRAAPEGAIFETQPTANAIAEEIGARLAEHGGAALFIDYGYLQSAPGDTLQAVRKHAFDDVLAHPGEADLTAHVNFQALAAAAARGGARVLPPLTQGDFLLRAGLLERAGALGAGKSHREQETIRDAVERLAAPGQMGDLFKVLAVTAPGISFPPFDSAS